MPYKLCDLSAIFLSLTSICCSAVVYADDTADVLDRCGPAPNTSYSDDYKEARQTLDQAAEKSNGNVSANVPDYFSGTGAWGSQSSSTHTTSMSVDHAKTIVAHESKTHAAEILGECGYRLCAIGVKGNAVANLAAIQSLGSVCTVAAKASLGNSESDSVGPTDGDTVVQFSPSSVVHVFEKDTEDVSVNAQRTAIDKIRLVPQAAVAGQQPLVTFLGKAAKSHDTYVDLGDKDNSHKSIVFQLNRPPEDNAIQVVDYMFTLGGSPRQNATVHFTLIHDESVLLPDPSLDCGSFNAHPYLHAAMVGQAASTYDPDRAGTKPPPAKLTANYDWPLSEGSNKVGAASHITASCTDQGLKNGKDRATLAFSDASNAHGSGEYPVTPGRDEASAGWLPEWTGTLTLPGSPSKYSYALRLDIDQIYRKSYGCSLKVISDDLKVNDSFPVTDRRPGSPPSSWQKSLSLDPGVYTLHLLCSQKSLFVDAQFIGSAVENISIDLASERSRKAVAPALTTNH